MLPEALAQLTPTRPQPHAWILEGMEGAETVEEWAKHLFCPEEIPCGRCGACTKLAAGSHPDLLRIRPEKGIISIDAVRGVTRALSMAPLEAAVKIVHIEDAHAMRVQAQNALLKTLEEPPAYGLLVLTTPNARRLLPTIRSRCRLERLPMVKRNATIDRDLLADLLTDVLSGDVARAFSAQTFFEDYKEDKEELLQEIELFLRDVLIYKETENPDLLTVRENAQRAASVSVGASALHRTLALFPQVREGFQRNVNFPLSMERILIECLEDTHDKSRRGAF